MTIGEVQSRIAHLQSMMSAVEHVGRTPGATTARGATTATSGTAFAAALDEASTKLDAHQHAPGAAHGHDHAPAKTAPGAGQAAGWAAPADGRFTSGFGPRWGTQHQGVDIANKTGSPVTAAASGVVRRANWYGGYGNAVIIDHGKGVQTLYGHNSKLAVKPGDRVQAGEKIAEMGSTGDSTGPHLHFEVQVNGKKINPRPWLANRGITL